MAETKRSRRLAQIRRSVVSIDKVPSIVDVGRPPLVAVSPPVVVDLAVATAGISQADRRPEKNRVLHGQEPSLPEGHAILWISIGFDIFFLLVIDMWIYVLVFMCIIYCEGFVG